jgi:uncharacterized repeat protein (TIGR02543 family)
MLGFVAPADYEFDGWLGSDGKQYNESDVVSATITLSAIWVLIPPVVKEYTVTYDIGDGDKTGAPTDGNLYKEGSTLTVAAGVPTRVGYVFAGWQFNDKLYLAGQTITIPANNVKFSAQWTPNMYIVKFDEYGGLGKMPDQHFAYGTAQELSNNLFARNNYRFMGWTIDPGGSVVFANRQRVNNLTAKHDDVITLYAKWQYIDVAPPGGGSGGGGADDDSPVVRRSSASSTVRRTPAPNEYPAPSPSVTITQRKNTLIGDERIPFGAVNRIFITDHVAYILGYPDGKVGPDEKLTRAEVATVFYRLLTDDLRERHWTLDNPLTDVTHDNWYNAAVSVIFKMGVIKGYEDGTFRPDNTITRAELAAIANRFATQMNMSGDNIVKFTDIADHWAKNDISRAAEIGWMSGYPNGTFRPDASITRAEFITLVNNVLERVPESEWDLLEEGMIVWEDNIDKNAWYYIAVQEATNSHYADTLTGWPVPGKQFDYETWMETRDNPNWIELERQWKMKYAE